MPWSSGLPGIRESSLQVILATLVGKLSDLNAAVAGISPSLPLGISITSGQFHIGDPDTLPDVSTSPFWVSVACGGKQDGHDQTWELKSQQGGYWRKVYTNIYFYCHPDALPVDGTTITNAFDQAKYRELLRARFADWLLEDVLATTGVGSLSLTLGSRTYASSPNYDTLDRCFVTDVTMGFVLKSYGQTQWVYMAHFLHQSEVYAG